MEELSLHEIETGNPSTAADGEIHLITYVSVNMCKHNDYCKLTLIPFSL